MRTASGRLTALCWVAGVTVGLDQATKLAVTVVDADRGPFRSVRNHDLALGLAGGGRVALVGVMLAVLAAATVWGARAVAAGRLPTLAVGLALGGAASNAVDRALLGSVRDVLTVSRWVINAADVAVVVGVAWILGRLLSWRAQSTDAD